MVWVLIFRTGVFLLTGTNQDFAWTVFDTLGFSAAQIAGNGYLLTHGDVDGPKRTGRCTFTAADTEFLIYLVYTFFIFSADSLGRTHANAGRIGTVSAGDREINQLGFIGNYLDAGEGRVEDFIVGKRADQFACPATSALGRKITFLKNHPF
jgi:hypothetical protein